MTGEDSGVSVPAGFTYLFADGREVPLLVRLGWSPSDPLVVSFRFVKADKTWRIGRDLIVDALTSVRVGDGDVRFWAPVDCPDCVGLELESPSGHAVFHAPRSALIDLIVRSEPVFRAAVDAWQDTWLEGVLA